MRLARDCTALFKDRKLRYAMIAPAANPIPAITPNRQDANRANAAPSMSMKRSIRGMAAEKKRSAGVSVGAGGGGEVEFMSCCLWFVVDPNRSVVRLVAGESRSHTDHLHESDDGAKDHSCEIKPMGMQPVIQEPADGISQEDGCRDDEADLGVARRRD